MNLRDHLQRLRSGYRSVAEHEAIEDARLYRNLLALLPYCSPARSAPPLTISAYCRPRDRQGPSWA